MQVRQDAGCAACAAFANSANAANAGDAAPCHEHGLFVRMKWNDDGARLIANESFHGHSVNWAAVPDGMEHATQVYRPVRVKSAGFTNEPNIPVRPASLANEGVTSDGVEQPAQMTVPPGLKVLAGYKEDEEVTMEQVIEALQKKMEEARQGMTAANAAEPSREALMLQLANERKGRAAALVDGLVRGGQVAMRDREASIELLCNAGERIEEAVAELANTRAQIKTEPRTKGLAGQHARAVATERERTSRFNQLLDARATTYPNESFEERFRAVADSHEGAQLFAQMTRPGDANAE
jgi:hypothetical protein